MKYILGIGALLIIIGVFGWIIYFNTHCAVSHVERGIDWKSVCTKYKKGLCIKSRAVPYTTYNQICDVWK